MVDLDALDALFDDIEEFMYAQPDEVRAERLEDKARAMPVGEAGRAQCLGHAAEWYEMRERYDDALRCLELARDDDGPVWLDTRVRLVSLFLVREEHDRADELARELRRSVDTIVNLDTALEWLGDAFADAGRLREAQRWFTLGLRDIDPDDLDDEDGWALGLLNGRYRARRGLGLGMDGYDRARDTVAEGVHERRRRTDGEWAIPDLDSEASLWGLIHWPEPEFEAFVARWPRLAEGYGGTYYQHRIETEQHLRQYSAIGADVAVAMASLSELLTFGRDKGLEPTLVSTRAAYAAELTRSGRAVPWPPGRDDPCWCGSSTAYRSCCRRHPDRPVDF